MKYIKRKSAVKVDKLSGSIVNTTNIENKAENTYSAEIIDGKLNEKDTNLNNLMNAIGIGKTQLPALGNATTAVDLDNLSLNGFAYIVNATYGTDKTSLTYGYLLQLTINDNYKFQMFTTNLTGIGAVLQYRKKHSGNWGSWYKITVTA